MALSKKIFANALGVIIVGCICTVFGMTANPILSRGKTVYTSSGNAPSLVDNKYGSGWNVGNNSWIAVKVSSGPTKVFFNWNDPVYAWSNLLSPSKCPNNNPMPVDYDILTSSNSTNGSDGQWTTAVSITGNIVTARGHLIDFTGMSWVKMAIKNGGGSIDEIEVFDASKGADDVWFFVGTSISANTYKGTPPSQNFADLVTKAHPAFNPAMIRGGIGCITTTDMVNNLPNYLKMARNAHFWAIEQGTNDAWGGTNKDVSTFTKNLQLIIDSCKAEGIQPIIARLLATNPSASAMATPTWQIHQDYEKAIDTLTKKNKLVAGPDLYAWFLAHPSELNTDGVHPNATGAASIQKLWADKMDSLYKVQTGVSSLQNQSSQVAPQNLFVGKTKGFIAARVSQAGLLQFYSAKGELLKSERFNAAGTSFLRNKSSLVLIRFTTDNGCSETKSMVW